jgi:restriction system protein
MAIPDFQTLMLPVLQLASTGERRIGDVVDHLATAFSLTDAERAQLLPSGRQATFANRVHWAKAYLAKAGLVELTRRAHFKITDAGRAVLQHPPDRIDIRFLGRFPAFQTFRAASEPDVQGPLPVSAADQSLTPDEMMRAAHRQLEAALATDLLDRIRTGSPGFFEKLVVRLLLSMGYGGGSATDLDRALVGGSGDGGIDGVIDQDILGLDRIYVQAKRYAEGNVVGSGAIRDFYGSLDMRKASKGVFVTASAFSAQATETADRLGKRIVLIDGAQLARLMIRHDVGCRVEETLSVKRIDEEFFE